MALENLTRWDVAGEHDILRHLVYKIIYLQIRDTISYKIP